MTAPSIPALLEPIQERLNAATPGPWQIEYLDEGIAEIATPDGGHVAIADGRQADAEFIAASPTDTARLLAAVKAVDEFIQDAAEQSPRELIPVPAVAGLLRNVVEAALRGEA